MKNSKLSFDTFLASGLGVGFIPKAPGTFGSLLAFGIYLLLPDALFSGINQLWYGIGLLLFSFISVVISTRAEKILGHDAPAIVIDEICGYFLTVLLLPHNLLIGIYAFALFRVFDIAKPFPVSVSQKLPRGWGIVIDDLLAAIYAGALLHILNALYPRFFG
ncbi:MAG TPA: phosphatidylglycerophosphatase A [Candidatus Cloacimonadota bacterium]|nr:phosphatidylglycerophosphatase A [Candidatus Cloacimonadota bacterium]HPS38221.1 phosphatidylglycerophosphatase A [Candidatus Cloacimonadota bacterium]